MSTANSHWHQSLETFVVSGLLHFERGFGFKFFFDVSNDFLLGRFFKHLPLSFAISAHFIARVIEHFQRLIVEKFFDIFGLSNIVTINTFFGQAFIRRFAVTQKIACEALALPHRIQHIPLGNLTHFTLPLNSQTVLSNTGSLTAGAE